MLASRLTARPGAEPGWTLVTVTCPRCQQQRSVEVETTHWQQFQRPDRPSVTVLFPYLNADERDMFLTSLCPVCWNVMTNPNGPEAEEDS